MKAQSKSLRKKFITQIILVFFIILVVLFFVFALFMKSFFAKTVLELDVMENQLIAEDTNVQISKYTNITEGLSQNANLIDMLILCKTPELFNEDHNFPLVAESLKRAQLSMPQNEQIWVLSLENQYTIRSDEMAVANPMAKEEVAQLKSLSHRVKESVIMENISDQQISQFHIVTPITRDGIVYGLIGTSLSIDDLLLQLEEKAGINNMFTACSLIVPAWDENFSLTGYHEFSMMNGQVSRTDLSVEFLSDYPSDVQTISQPNSASGKKFISEIGSSKWYLSSFVTDDAVSSAFYESYSAYGVSAYFVVIVVVLLLVWLLSLKMTQPIHDLGALVSNIRNHRPYEQLKGNNEITQAADSLIELIYENQLLLDEIEDLASGIERGELYRRLEEHEDSKTRIKGSLNQMLDSILHILDHLPLSLSIIDEDEHILYLNQRLQSIVGVTSAQVKEGMSVSQVTGLDKRTREKISIEIQECHRNGISRETKLLTLGIHLVCATVKLNYAQKEGEKDIFLQVYPNQTDLINKISEQEQVLAYFTHLSRAKTEALDRLSKGDFRHASMEIGQRPSAAHLQAVYDDQLETKRAFNDTVINIEQIIQQLNDATQSFANGNLHTIIDAHDARGSYAELVQTANHAFDIILNYFQALPIPIRIIGKDYKVNFFNRASYAIGFRPGRNVFCYHAYHLTEPCENCPYLTENDMLNIREFSCMEDGQTQYWKVYRNPMRDQKGQIIRILEIRIDETEVVQLTKAADSANMAKSTFIANMSHEIRTPLNAIIGYSQLLELSKTLKDKTSIDYVATIRRSGHHLLGLINDILEISKIEAGKITLLKETFNLHDLLEDVKSMFLPQMQAKNLSFEIICPSNMECNVMGDIGKVRQIILNVVSNSLKFTQEGQIQVTANTQKEDSDRLRFCVDISDTGVGICQKDWEQVFDAFEQTASGNKSGTGTGLGMAISRNFARMMGGDLTILQSEEGIGTTFRMEIFLDKDSQEHSKSQSDSVFNAIRNVDGNYTILIADSVEESRDILQKILDQVGIHVLTTCNGETAFNLWQSNTPDLIITDLSLQGVDGLSLIQMIRRQEKNWHTPILVLTTRALEQDKEAALLAGADRFLTKPFMVGKLMQEISAMSNIRYHYEEPCTEALLPESAVKEMISSETIEKILDALKRGDFDTVIGIANSLAPDFPVFATRLEQYADDFDKDAILNLLND